MYLMIGKEPKEPREDRSRLGCNPHNFGENSGSAATNSTPPYAGTSGARYREIKPAAIAQAAKTFWQTANSTIPQSTACFMAEIEPKPRIGCSTTLPVKAPSSIQDLGHYPQPSFKFRTNPLHALSTDATHGHGPSAVFPL
ncbi:unnamed protein product, partial [Mesorhabditis spiculigera]